MLTITVLGEEHFDNDKEEFVYVGSVVLNLEHSLLSVSKWEQIYEKPFLSDNEKTDEETLSYIRCMLLTADVPDEVLYRLTQENVDEIDTYINRKMTATWFSDTNGPKNKQVITNELLYYWMFSLSIPKECDEWHLNRLFTLIQVFSANNGDKKQQKESPAAAAERRSRINAERRKATGSSG